MRVAMIGAGYVGLVSGACFANFGHTVICVDKDVHKVEGLKKGEMPIFEPGLAELVEANAKAGRLSFTTDTANAVKAADAVFIAVGTPSRKADGHADLSYVFQAAREIALAVDGEKVVVTKSTVPVGTGDEVSRIIADTNPAANVAVVSNPEFLREGAAIQDFMKPDRIVVGTTDTRARAVMAELYRPFEDQRTPILYTERRGAEQAGADVQEVARGIGLDNRIGPNFLQPGPGYGGSCFPKDLLALLKAGVDYGTPIRSIETIISINEQRKRSMARKITAACGGSIRGKTVAVLGLTFKSNTDDMRESPAITVIAALQDVGAKVRAFDPEGMEQARSILNNVEYANDAYSCAEGADVLVILTEWDMFKSLDLAKVRSLLKTPVLVDLRNIYRPADMVERGFSYHSVGRPTAERRS
jgi:UDPglucose 6-dehydrogenase